DGQRTAEHRMPAQGRKVVQQRGPFEVDLKTVRELQALGGNPAAETTDRQFGIVVNVMRMDVVDEALLENSARMNLLRYAARQADKVVVVDVQVDSPAPQLSEIGHIRRPIGLGDHAAKVGRPQFAVSSRGNRVGGELEFGEKGQDMPDQQRDL